MTNEQEAGENKMPERVTIFTNKPHIQKIWELCDELGLSLNKVVKEMVKDYSEVQIALLEKQLEQKRELEKLKEKLKGGATKNQKKS